MAGVPYRPKVGYFLSQVAQTRLENRTYRPNVELCRDSAQYQLCHEVREIEGTVKALIEKLQESQNAHNSLTDNLLNIEEDLSVKVTSNSYYELGLTTVFLRPPHNMIFRLTRKG